MCGEELWPDKMLNVKCQNVSEKHSEPTREIISNSGVSVLPITHHTRQTIVFYRQISLSGASKCVTFAKFDGCL